jgi:hypothetical protein
MHFSEYQSGYPISVHSITIPVGPGEIVTGGCPAPSRPRMTPAIDGSQLRRGDVSLYLRRADVCVPEQFVCEWSSRIGPRVGQLVTLDSDSPAACRFPVTMGARDSGR